MFVVLVRFGMFGGVVCPLVWCGVLLLFGECFVGRFVVGCVSGRGGVFGTTGVHEEGVGVEMCFYCVSVFWLFGGVPCPLLRCGVLVLLWECFVKWFAGWVCVCVSLGA